MSRYIDVDKVCEMAIIHKDFGQCIADLVSLKEVLRDTPTADVAPVKHGQWIKDNDSFQTDDYYCCYFDHICSECGKVVNDRYKLPNYCPNCGAKMDGERKDENV